MENINLSQDFFTLRFLLLWSFSFVNALVAEGISRDKHFQANLKVGKRDENLKNFGNPGTGTIMKK